MVQTKETADVHYRLFAILVMFITLLLGMGIGFLGGYDVGQQNALELLQQGRTAEATTVQVRAIGASETSQSVNQPIEPSSDVTDKIESCKKDVLGNNYENYQGGKYYPSQDEYTKISVCYQN